jgi:nicotinamidase-related amidase
MRSLLITDCLQRDFVGPVGRYESLPNALHVGHDESLRLLGANPEEGPVARMMAWAHRQPDEALRVVHIRDWHDASDARQREHLEQFGAHCLAGSPGAAFVFPLDDAAPGKRLELVDATTLSNFEGTRFEAVLAPLKAGPMRIGLAGVWTEAKITFLAYDLRARYPHFELAVCSALTASSSRANHFLALDQLERILGVQVIPSVGEFIEYLGGRSESAPLIGFSQKHPEVKFRDQTALSDADRQLVRYLFRGCREVSLRTLDGGFSGNTVLGALSVDLHGHEQAPHVVKIGPRGPIGQERECFERIESVLGNSAPRVADFADLESRGAIKYRYAAMGSGGATSFQKRYQEGAPDQEVRRVLDAVFVEQLGRLYRAAELERCDLLSYYEFDPKWAPSVRRNAAALAEGDATIAFANGARLPHVALFYERALAALPRFPRTHHMAYVHGDLNGANIVLDTQHNVWLIDFFHTHRGHVLRDLAKLENDLLYIFTKLADESELAEALHISDLLMRVDDLSAELPDARAAGVTSPKLARAYEHVRLLRGYYPALIKADRDPLQLLLAQLRYAVHTLSFDESSRLQKQWALYSACLAAQEITHRMSSTGRLRIDWLPQELTAPGRIGLTLAPGRRDQGRRLEDDLSVLRAEGVTAVLCLLTPDELVHYGIEGLIEAYRGAGIEALHVPTMDGRVPNEGELGGAVAWIGERTARGQRVLVHCAGGLGRAGTVAACWLRSRGLDAEQAIRAVRDCRSPRAIETPAQETAIRQWRSR